MNGADIYSTLFGYLDLNLTQAEAALPLLSVSGRKVDSRSNVAINNIVWNKLLIGQQIVLLTYKNGNTCGAQYPSSDLDFDNCSQILSTYKITN